MADPDVSSRMRTDWNARAKEDAGYYVAFGRRDQSDADFFATATEIVNSIETELRRFPKDQRGALRALEIGCGPGRLMRPLARHFQEIHGVDVSDEMIALGRQKLADVPHARFHATDGARLADFADESVDFVYSYAVFQHIPSRDVVSQYMREIHRVLRVGGMARLQFNGLPQTHGGFGYGDPESPRDPDAGFDTWSGARFASSEILEFTQTNDIQILALEGATTQYMWTSWLKRSPGWQMAQEDAAFDTDTVRIRRITNAHSSEPVAPSRGRFSSISVWVESLPEEAGLHHLRVAVGDSFGTVTHIGPKDNVGIQQVTVILPELEATGLLPVELRWIAEPIANQGILRVIPPGPSVPAIRSVTDGVNLVAGRRVETRTVKVTLEEVAHPEDIQATIDGQPVVNLEFFCVDPRPQKFEINFHLPDEIGPGQHELRLSIGRRKLAPVLLDVVA